MAKLTTDKVWAIVQAQAEKEKSPKETPAFPKKKRIPKAPPNESTKHLLSLSSVIALETIRTGSFGAKEVKKIGKWFRDGPGEIGFEPEKIEKTFSDPATLPYHRETLEKCIQAIIAFLTGKWDKDLETWFLENYRENVISQPRIHGGGIGFTNPDKNLSCVFRGFLIFTIADSFGGMNASGYLGVCPRCGRIFSKKRSDELYDRKTCQVEATRGNTKR